MIASTIAGQAAADLRFTLARLVPARAAATLVEDARIGLSSRPRQLPPKYFYDATGSRLYDAICRTREYYPARTEAALLARFARDIVDETRPQTVIELGSGASRKTVQILQACERVCIAARYVPIDICADMLVQAAHALIARYPWLAIDALAGDYTLGLAHLPAQPGPRLFLFLGGTIGNFHEDEAVAFLCDLRNVMQPGDSLLLGADRVKDPVVLNAAYNDADGLTARFNLNLLHVLNRELGAHFDPADFAHEAGFNEPASRIEMRLRARRAHAVRVSRLGASILFDQDESILTEISRKFTSASLARLLRSGGFRVQRQYQPANRYFSLVLAAPA